MLAESKSIIKGDFIKDFFVYSAGSIFTQINNVILIFFFMHYLPADAVGFFSLSTSSILLISTLISCGLRQFFMLEFFNLASDARKRLVNDIIAIYIIISIGVFFVAWLVHKPINRLFFADLPPLWLYILIFLQIFLIFFTELFYQALMYTLQSKQITLIKSIMALFVTGGSIIAIFYCSYGVEAVVVIQLIASIILCLYAFTMYRARHMVSFFDGGRALGKSRAILQASAPLMPTVLAGLLLASGNRWVLSAQASLADVAVYSIAEYVAPLFNLLILYPLGGAYLPRIMQLFNQASLGSICRIEDDNKKIMWSSMALVFFIGSGLYLIARPIALHCLPVGYHGAILGAYLIFLANIFLMGTFFTTSLLLYAKKSGLLLLGIACAAGINLALTFFLAPHYGMHAAYASYLIAYFCYFSLIYLFNVHIAQRLG